MPSLWTPFVHPTSLSNKCFRLPLFTSFFFECYQKGPEIRTGLMANDQDVKIPAGHEFYVTTDEAYAEKGTAEMIYMDYVSDPLFEHAP